MRKNLNSAFKIVGMMIILSFMLTGCYTQLSRPRVATEDEYYNNPQYEDDEYYQDEGAQDPAIQDGGDTYIYNYYSPIDPYFDYWNYYPYSWNNYRWSYLGPYPDYWWDPYGRWWTPGWYGGFYFYDSWWGGHPRHRNSYYGYYSNPSQRSYTQRPFGRRSIDTADRQQRIVDTQSGLARPQSPNRVDRPTSTVASPDFRDKSASNEAKRVPASEKQVRPNSPSPKNARIVDDARRQTTVKPRTPDRRSEPQKVSPRNTKSHSKPKMIEAAPQNKSRDNNRSYKPTKRSSSNNSSPARSSNPQVSKPSTRSSAPRSSATTKSSGSSSSSGSKGSSSSKSSGSSKTNKK